PSPHISTLSLHDALPIYLRQRSTNGYASTHVNVSDAAIAALPAGVTGARPYRSNIGSATNLVGDTGDNWYDDDSVNLRLSYSPSDRKSTRLNSSHVKISY